MAARFDQATPRTIRRGRGPVNTKNTTSRVAIGGATTTCCESGVHRVLALIHARGMVVHGGRRVVHRGMGGHPPSVHDLPWEIISNGRAVRTCGSGRARRPDAGGRGRSLAAAETAHVAKYTPGEPWAKCRAPPGAFGARGAGRTSVDRARPEGSRVAEALRRLFEMAQGSTGEHLARFRGDRRLAGGQAAGRQRGGRGRAARLPPRAIKRPITAS